MRHPGGPLLSGLCVLPPLWIDESEESFWVVGAGITNTDRFKKTGESCSAGKKLLIDHLWREHRIILWRFCMAA